MAMNRAGEAIGGPGQAIAREDARWDRLHAIVEAHSLLRGDFTLTSGRKSSYLFQLRQTALHPEGAFLIGRIIVDVMRRERLACIGGLEMGAVPVVTAVAAASFEAGYPVDAFFVRKATKRHGAKERVDGHVRDGAEVLMVDDVTTTGGSIVKAIEGLEEERTCTVRQALSILDREEGAAENLAERGIRLVSIFRTSDFQI